MNMRVWVLQVKQVDYPTDRAEDDRNSKFLSEIYLTRLLKTKVTFFSSFQTTSSNTVSCITLSCLCYIIIIIISCIALI